MIRLIYWIVSCVALIVKEARTLRVCDGYQEVDCILPLPRMELRQLNGEQRRQLINGFMDEKSQHNRREWERILESELVTDVIRRLDDRLSVEGFFTPFWDPNPDRLLPDPVHSTLFLDEFLPKSKSRGGAGGKERATPKKRRELSHPLSIFRRTKNSQLLYLLNQIGTTMVNRTEDCIFVCGLYDEFLFCDPVLDRCVAKVVPGGNCSTYIGNLDVCYNSDCVDGVCVKRKESRRKERESGEFEEANREQKDVDSEDATDHRMAPSPESKKTRSSAVTSTLEIGAEVGSGTEPIDLLVDEVDNELSGTTPSTTEKTIETKEDRAAERLKTREHRRKERKAKKGRSRQFRTLSLQALINRDAADAEEYKQRHAYNVADVGRTSSPTTTRPKQKAEMLHPKNSMPLTSKVLRPLSHIGYLPEGAIPWDREPPFPIAYFTVTIVEGRYRRRARKQRFASDVTVYSTGKNMPNGYTQILEGNRLNGTTIVRILDPDTTFITEFEVSVIDKHGRPCEQTCLSIKGTYKECSRMVQRLSQMDSYSDDIPIYKELHAAIESQWIGQGYFRKRRHNHLLFTCQSSSKRRRHSTK